MNGKLRAISLVGIVTIICGLCSCTTKNENIQKTEVTTEQSITNNKKSEPSNVKKSTISKSTTAAKKADTGKSTVINKHYHENKYIYNNDVENNKTENNINNNTKVETEINNTENNINIQEEENNVDVDNNETIIDVDKDETDISIDNDETNIDIDDEKNSMEENQLIVTVVSGIADENIVSFIKETIKESDSVIVEFLDLETVENLDDSVRGKVLYTFSVVDGNEESSIYYYDEDGGVIYKVTKNIAEVLKEEVKILETTQLIDESEVIENNLE